MVLASVTTADVGLLIAAGVAIGAAVALGRSWRRAKRRAELDAHRLEALRALAHALANPGPLDTAEDRIAELCAAALEGDSSTGPFADAVNEQCAQAVIRVRLQKAGERLAQVEEILGGASLTLPGAPGTEGVIAALEAMFVPRLADRCMVERGAAKATRDDVPRDPHRLVVALAGVGRMILERDDRPYDRVDRALVNGVALRADQVLASARLYDEHAHTSTTLQRSLLPSGLIPVPNLSFAARYVAATETQEVGGDFYDIVTGPAGEAVLIIGDVQGKGIEAASLTAVARHTLRTGALHGDSPATMLCKLNRALLYGERERLVANPQADPRFVTAAVVTLSPTPTGFRAIAASGGHPPPIIVRAAGDVKAVPVAGMILGVFEAPNFDEQIEDLALADTVLLYTDGVTERDHSSVFDERGLARLVRNRVGPADAEAVAQLVLDTVLLLAPGHPRDDLAVVVACVTGPR
jgi:serine phosphatase RsbU (regulator of sigma subunit)